VIGEDAMNTTKPDSRIQRFCEAIIAKRLGDISALPNRLVKHVFCVYGDFIAAYLNVLRQKEGKPPDWFPESLSIDPALGDEMRHFFSDYQHITKAFLTLNKQMDELRKIDKDKQSNLYEHMVASILSHEHR
jgi:Lhr-like helicase